MGLHYTLNCLTRAPSRIYAGAWMAAPRHPHRDGTLSGSLKSYWGRTHERVLSKPNGMISPPPQAVHVIGSSQERTYV